MMPHKRRAIVYVAWGAQHIEEAVASAATAGIADVDRLLITDADSRVLLRPSCPFEQIIEHAFALPGLLAKTEMLPLLPHAYDSFLYLDTDTRILLDIDQGFEKAERHGIAAAQATAYALEHFWGFGKVLEETGFQSREILQYNAGVIFFTRAASAWQVMQKWHELCVAAGPDAAAWTDQPYLTLAMELLGFNPYTLSIAYNYRSWGEHASGRIRIWHSHFPPPPDVNEFDQPWPPRRFLHGRRLPDQA
jgi:hypothetical protein